MRFRDGISDAKEMADGDGTSASVKVIIVPFPSVSDWIHEKSGAPSLTGDNDS